MLFRRESGERTFEQLILHDAASANHCQTSERWKGLQRLDASAYLDNPDSIGFDPRFVGVNPRLIFFRWTYLVWLDLSASN